jgi:hypothetical protein
MRKKYILALQILAVGIALEVILLAGIIITRAVTDGDIVTQQHASGQESAALPAMEGNEGLLPTFEAIDTPADSYVDPPQDSAPPLDPAVGYPAPGLDADHIPGSEPVDSANQPQAYPGPVDLGNGGNPDPPDDSYPPPVDNNPPPAAPTVPPVPTATLPPVATNTPIPAATTPVPIPTRQPATTTPVTPSGNTLVAVRGGTEPILDGLPGDPAWSAAPETLITTAGGANASAATISLRAVYDSQRIYMLLSWTDPTVSWLRSPWEKQADGTWKRLVSPVNAGSDESVYDEDKIGLLWPIANSLPGFNTLGCGSACHEGDAPSEKPYGSMYTAAQGQIADLWNWKAARNVSQVDDLYLDSTRYSKEAYWAGFKTDPGDGGYSPNQTADRSRPEFMPVEPGKKDAWPGYISDSAKLPLDDGLFQPGDRVAGAIAAPFTGDRGDISAAWQHVDGHWVLELSRKLVTGSPYDVQFADLSQAYLFSLATFDNTQIRHAYPVGATELRFQK